MDLNAKQHKNINQVDIFIKFMEQHQDLARRFVKGDRVLCDQLWACTFFTRSFLNCFLLKSIIDNNKAPDILIPFYFYKKKLISAYCSLVIFTKTLTSFQFIKSVINCKQKISCLFVFSKRWNHIEKLKVLWFSEHP